LRIIMGNWIPQVFSFSFSFFGLSIVQSPKLLLLPPGELIHHRKFIKM
jgi:hypothetical protein